MKSTLLFVLSILSLFMLSCEQEEFVQPKLVTQSDVSVSNITSVDSYRSNLLFEGRFEPSLDPGFRSQVYTTYGFELSSSIKRNGAKSARFEMRSSSDKIRSEILKDEESQSNRWFGNSLYLPSEDWASDLLPDGWEIITQWHALDDAGEPARFPPLALVVSKGRLSFQIYWSTRGINTNSNYDGKKIFDLGPVEKDKWLDMVYHINFSHQSDGVLEVWKNGVKVVDFKGPNCYNDDKLPYMKMGIYKRGWNKITKRVIYIDEVRVGNGNATYNDVAPSGSTVTNPDPEEPAATEQLSLVLMNANTDLPIQTLSAGATLDLAALPTYNLNIAATSEKALGSVVFNLTGAETKNTTQSGAPYSLFGDIAGDHQSWTPTNGNYSLTATPYSAANGTGTAGKATTVSFKVVNQPADGSGIPSATMVINNNAATTSATQATLNITTVNATQMRFYDNANSDWTNWEPVATSKPWTLSSGDGSKWVILQVQNEAGVMSTTYSDDITLKTSTGTPTVTMVINNNAATSSSTQATLNITAVNAAQMRFYDNANSNWTSWEPVAATKAWTLSSGDGSKWVKVQVRNTNGVMSTTYSDDITLKTGTGTPTVTMVINNNAATTSSTQATLNITAVNATQMRFYDNANSNWTSWEPIAATKAWTLSSGDGSKWVKVQVRNAAGVMSTSTHDGITLKTL